MFNPVMQRSVNRVMVDGQYKMAKDYSLDLGSKTCAVYKSFSENVHETWSL